MIVRILGEGQYRLEDAELDILNALDDDVEAAAVPATRSGSSGPSSACWPRSAARASSSTTTS